jgi:hypothetical protein
MLDCEVHSHATHTTSDRQQNMKVQFLVTIEGDWQHNEKPVTAAMAEQQLREAIKEKFEFLARRRTIKRIAAGPREQARAADVDSVKQQLEHAIDASRLGQRSYGWSYDGVKLAGLIEAIAESISPELAPASTMLDGETISIQEVWVAAGGNPDIKATRQQLLDAAKMMDEAIDECDEKHSHSSGPADQRGIKELVQTLGLAPQHQDALAADIAALLDAAKEQGKRPPTSIDLTAVHELDFPARPTPLKKVEAYVQHPSGTAGRSINEELPACGNYYDDDMLESFGRQCMTVAIMACTKRVQKRIMFLEKLVDSYGPKALQYDIEHPDDGINVGQIADTGESVMDATGLPIRMGDVITSNGSLPALERLYEFLDHWGAVQRDAGRAQYAAEVKRFWRPTEDEINATFTGLATRIMDLGPKNGPRNRDDNNWHGIGFNEGRAAAAALARATIMARQTNVESDN